MLNQRKSERLDFCDDKVFTATDPGLAPHYTLKPVIDYSGSGIIDDRYETAEEGNRREGTFFRGIIVGVGLSIPLWLILIGLGYLIGRYVL